MRRFEEKVVLITGAASGIGRATALRLAEEGAKLFCTDLQAEAVEQTVKEAETHGTEATAHVCDVSDPGQAKSAVQACVDRFGRLDVLLNVAGILKMEPTEVASLETWNKILSVNLTGTFLMCQAALPHLLESSGNIVNTSSTAALAGAPWSAAYAASKGGVSAMTRTFAIEFGKKGLRANAVCPGSIKTPMTSRSVLPEGFDSSLLQRLLPLDKARGPETVASTIAFLASEDACHINGEEIRIDGAMLS